MNIGKMSVKVLLLDVLVDLMGFLASGKALLFVKAIKVVYSFKENAQKILRIT